MSAPYISPVTGSYKLCCVAIKWTDNPGVDIDSVKNSAAQTIITFSKLSQNQFNFTSSTYSISVPYTRSALHVPLAVSYCKQYLAKQGIIQDGKLTYVMVNNNAEAHSHSGGDTSNLLDTLTTTFYHEIGRDTPTDLGSSGAFVNGIYVNQGDGTTFMGHFASDKLTASQLYYLGWLPNTQVALFPGKTTEYTIVPLNIDDTTSLKAVLITDSESKKPLFLSRPTFTEHGDILYTLHLATNNNNRGSERVVVFDKNTTYSGLSFNVISTSGNDSIIQISINEE